MKFAAGTVLEPEHVKVEEIDEVSAVVGEAHVGLLRNHHTYRAEIPIEHSLGTNVIAEHPQHNIYVTVLDVSETEELKEPNSSGERYSSVVAVKVHTIKDGKIAEKIQIVSEGDRTQRKEVLVTAKVLLTNQGNPLLKDGVHLICHHHEDESDFTEWPGHGRSAS